MNGFASWLCRAREAWERGMDALKPFDVILQVINTAWQRLVISQKRVLRGTGATQTVKRRQRLQKPCD